MTQSPISNAVPLDGSRDRSGFDCGNEALNSYLLRYSWQNQKNNYSRTFVMCRDLRVVGYYTLVAGSVSPADVPQSMTRGSPKHNVPIILLARLAVDRPEQGQGVGKAFLKHAALSALAAADFVGCRAMMVHAKDATAAEFYVKYGFEQSPVNALTLFMLTSDLEASL